MEDGSEKKRKFTKKKFAQTTAPIVGLHPKTTAVGAVFRPTATTVVRKVLNIPQNYEAQLAKQLTSYKHSKSMEMFKERNMKFTCVAEQRDKNVTGESSSSTPACPVNLLHPNELEAIRTYEEREKIQYEPMIGAQIPVSTFGDCQTDFGPDKFAPFPTDTLAFARHQAEQNMQKKSAVLTQPQPVESSSIVMDQQQTGIKQETEIEISDEIPSFSHSAILNSTHQLQTPTEVAENEKQKRKLQLLWSICQEELTVESELDKKGKRIQEIRKSIDTLAKSLKSEEKAQENLQQRKNCIAEKKRKLLTSASDGGAKMIKREEQLND